jgi:quercetin dioxygenase-like cupin family protein
MNKAFFQEQLEKEGFKHIYEWKDKPETAYAEHKHQDKVTLYILDGDITFYIDGQTIELKKGDRFDVPPGKDHAALVGPEGCSYLVGEMIEGDS